MIEISLSNSNCLLVEKKTKESKLRAFFSGLLLIGLSYHTKKVVTSVVLSIFVIAFPSLLITNYLYDIPDRPKCKKKIKQRIWIFKILMSVGINVRYTFI